LNLNSSIPYNGITYFDVGTEHTCDTTPAAADQETTIAFSNGVTVFDNGQKSGATGSCANRTATQIMMTGTYNGATVF
jgi:hypothetical protein